MSSQDKVRAISLLSGGLDSLLAIRVLMEQGIDVTGITFTSPFFGAANARRGAEQLGIRLIVLDITEDHLTVVKNPPHGYGKCMNPCIDCHSLMVCKAGEIMRREGFDFIATGEVLGERPMSQNMQSLKTVERESGCEGLLLRPLSAKLLTITRPETQGKVDRSRLFDFRGRSRKPQMALAEQFGIKSYVQPAGGCLLTDPAFSVRLAELLKAKPEATAGDMQLLKLGRHFRLPSGAKAIVGRNKEDNARIEDSAGEGVIMLSPETIPGPTVLLLDGKGRHDVWMAAKLCASFSDHGDRAIDLEIIAPSGKERLTAIPGPRSEFLGMRI